MDRTDRRPSAGTIPIRDPTATGPMVGDLTTRLERRHGRGCLFSLIVVVLAVIVAKRFLHLSWTGLGLVALVKFALVFATSVRLRLSGDGREDAA